LNSLHMRGAADQRDGQASAREHAAVKTAHRTRTHDGEGKWGRVGWGHDFVQ